MRTAKPLPDKNLILWDSGGDVPLYMVITPRGKKSFRLRYTRPVTQKDGSIKPTMTSARIGRYPAMSIAQAREKARKLLGNADEGENISKFLKTQAAQKVAEEQLTFGKIAAEWIERHRKTWSQRYANDLTAKIKLHLLPALENVPVSRIDDDVLRPVLLGIEKRGGRVARLCRMWALEVLAYARTDTRRRPVSAMI